MCGVENAKELIAYEILSLVMLQMLSYATEIAF